MTKNRLIFAVIACIFLILGLVLGARQMQAEAPPSGPVARFLSLSLPDIKGQAQNLGQWKGRTLVINFWATWCTPCVEEMPALSALQAEVATNNVQLLGIGIDSPSNIAQFLSKLEISYPLYVAGMEGTELSQRFGNNAGGLPFTVLVGADGKVKKTYLGRLKFDELRKDLAQLQNRQ